HNLVAHDKARQQADAELTDEIDRPVPLAGPLGAFADSGQELVDLLLGEADAVVGKRQSWRLVRALGDVDDNLAAVPGFQVGAGADRIDGVLKQFADEDVGFGVEVVGQQVDQPAEVNLKLMVHVGLSGFWFAVSWQLLWRERGTGCKVWNR